MSSGTIGAALSGALALKRSIAISYGIVVNPPPPSYFEPAHALASRISLQLWEQWGPDDGGLRKSPSGENEVDLYNVNIPLVENLLIIGDGAMEVHWTQMWRNAYGRLFKTLPPAPTDATQVKPAGPDADAQTTAPQPQAELSFKFAPDMSNLIPASGSAIPEGTDGWAMHTGRASVTALRASFAEPLSVPEGGDRLWKMKL
jgi:5'/3'-nucleotidase SurE